MEYSSGIQTSRKFNKINHVHFEEMSVSGYSAGIEQFLTHGNLRPSTENNLVCKIS